MGSEREKENGSEIAREMGSEREIWVAEKERWVAI
jgi:hypothetical protein